MIFLVFTSFPKHETWMWLTLYLHLLPWKGENEYNHWKGMIYLVSSPIATRPNKDWTLPIPTSVNSLIIKFQHLTSVNLQRSISIWIVHLLESPTGQDRPQSCYYHHYRHHHYRHHHRRHHHCHRHHHHYHHCHHHQHHHSPPSSSLSPAEKPC